jgi:hypothetical protein
VTGFDSPSTLYVYAHSGSEITIGASFRIQDDLFGDILTVTPEPGVTILSGDVLSGIMLSWPPHALDHEPILALEVSPGYGGEATATDIVFWQTTGSYPGEDVTTAINSFPHCSTYWAGWQVPDTTAVVIDAIEEFTIKAIVHTEQPYGGTLSMVDTEGWVTGLSSDVIPFQCWACPWHWGVIDITVAVPDTVAPQTLNTITLQCNYFGQVIDEVDIVLRAVEPVATEPTSFGRLKALYRRQNNERK